MGDANEHEDNEHAPLLNTEQPSLRRNYEGIEDQDTGIGAQEEHVTREEERYTAPQQQPVPDAPDESRGTSRPTGASVTCRVCSATIIIEGKVSYLMAFRRVSKEIAKEGFLVFFIQTPFDSSPDAAA